MRYSFLLLSSFCLAISASQTPLLMSKHVAVSDPLPYKEGPDIFTPKDLVELVRPGTGVANQAGDVGFISVSKYSFEKKKNEKNILVFPIRPSSASDQFASIPEGEAVWLDSDTIGHIVVNEEAKVQELHVVPIKRESNGAVSTEASSLIGKFPLSDLGNFKYSPQAGALVFSAYVWPDVNLSTVKEQDEAYENRGNSARVYDRLFVRHWDTWKGPKTQTLFSVTLNKADGKWTLGEDFVSLIGTLEHSTPVEPFGGTDNFDVSGTHIVYTTKDPNLDPATHTRQNIYLVPIRGGEPPKHLTSGTQGATNSPVFNKQGTKIAWTEMAKDGYEADRAEIVLYDLEKNVRTNLTSSWDRSASQLTFSAKGDQIVFTALDGARSRMFSLDLQSFRVTDASLTVADSVAQASFHSVSNVQPLEDGRILFTQSSLTSPAEVFVWSPPGVIEQITRLSEEGLKGKTLDAGEEFWVTGSDGFNVQSWVLKPKGYVKGSGKKWPVLLIVHGGPQSSTADSWSTRWNPNVFAQQGYFVVAPNPTGSTGFGQEFTDRIALNWGSKPFEDLIAVWKAVLNAYPDIDPDNAVAAGASWGGFAMNWINGHPEYGFNLKALVCHDGVFDARYNGYATDELFFFNHDFGGPLWSSKVVEQWNPSNFIEKFSVPQLLIHGSRDYRLPETESLGVYNSLQQRGIDTRIVVFPDENHWVLNHGNSLKWHEEVLGWFAKYIKE